MIGGEWVRLPNGNWRFFTDQELSEMNAAQWKEDKPLVLVLLSISTIFLFSLGSILLYCAFDFIGDGDNAGMIVFGTLGISAIGLGIYILKISYPDILITFIVTLIVVAFALWGLYSYFKDVDEEFKKMEQEQKEKSENVYEPIPAEFYQYEH